MGALLNGQWETDDSRVVSDIRFVRSDSVFRARVGTDARFPAEAGRYHLFVSVSCPWAHRTLIFRVLKGLEQVIGLTWLEPANTPLGWRFNPAPDPLTGAGLLYELYQRSDPAYTGRVTVPVLWDSHAGTIVNNESSEIIRMFNADFDALAGHAERDYYPAALRAQIDTVNARVFGDLNAGVYKAGFATSQAAYETAARAVFATLDWMQHRLTSSRYLCGDVLTEADWRAFPTLVRFDAVYHHLFKCNWRRLADYPVVHAYTRELYQHPGIAATLDVRAIQRGYYSGMRNLNANGIVPIGPDDTVLDFAAPHGR